jgi:hypothetical protein
MMGDSKDPKYLIYHGGSGSSSFSFGQACAPMYTRFILPKGEVGYSTTPVGRSFVIKGFASIFARVGVSNGLCCSP